MFTGLIALLLSAIATLLPAPAHHHAVTGPPAARPEAEAPTGGGHRGTVPAPPPAVAPTVAPPTDVATQAPAETNGRQIDCPDGVHVGVMVDGAVTGCS